MPKSTCRYQGEDFLVQGSLLYDAVYPICTQYNVLPDWGGGTDAYTPIGVQLALEDGRIYLRQIKVITEDRQYAPIAGCNPTPPSDTERYATYSDLRIPIPGNGGLFLLKDQVWSSGCISGFSTPFDYRLVLEVEMKGGRVVSVVDRSEEAELARAGRGPSPEDTFVSIVSMDRSVWPKLLDHINVSPLGTWTSREIMLVKIMCRNGLPTPQQAQVLADIIMRVEQHDHLH